MRRLTQEDPIGQAGGLDLYGYANGDPLNFSDPFGLCPQESPWTPECGKTIESAEGLADPVGWLAGGIAGGIESGLAHVSGRVVPIHELRREVPELEALYLEHLRDNDDLLPHVSMAEIARFTEEVDAEAAQGSQRATGLIERLLATLERGRAEGD